MKKLWNRRIDLSKDNFDATRECYICGAPMQKGRRQRDKKVRSWIVVPWRCRDCGVTLNKIVGTEENPPEAEQMSMYFHFESIVSKG